MDSFLIQIKDIVLKYQNPKIIILGKGASIDLIELNKLNNFIKIGINDVEQLIECDFSIFNNIWVIKSIASNQFKSKLYISPFVLNSANSNHFVFKSISNNHDNIDQMFARLSTANPYESFFVEDSLIITALKLSRIISKLIGKILDVYFVGFDFDPNQGYSKKLNLDFSHSIDYMRNVKIGPQEQYFLKALYLLDKSEINVIHVGNKFYSKILPHKFNDILSHRHYFNSNYEKYKIKVVAELTTNHFGDRNRLERMIRLAYSSGADYVKLQKRDIETFYSKKQLDDTYHSPFGSTFRDYRKKLELNNDDFIFVDKLCKELGMKWFVSVLDLPSFYYMQKFGLPIIKLPSTISEHSEFIQKVAENYYGDIVISTGMTEVGYVNKIIELFRSNSKLYLMHTNSAYPTPIEDANISIIKFYEDLSRIQKNIIPAYSSHDDGFFGSILAVASGAKMIEKHVKIGSNSWAHFDSVALDLEKDDFKNYVSQIRKAEIALGSSEKKINKSENHKY